MSLFVDIPSDPIAAFDDWLKDAAQSEPNDPNAMALATVAADGMPNARMVLLKGHDARGFVFYTNLESQKGNELEANAKAALVFHWKSLHRQVRVQGPISAVSDEEADAYYQSRGRESRIGAWASQQSRPLSARAELEAAAAETLAAAAARGEALTALGSVVIAATAGEEGKLFGSVGTRDIAEALTAAGCEVDKAEVRLPEGAIRELGEFEVMIQLHAEVTTSVSINIVAE